MHRHLMFKLDQDPKGSGLRCDDAGLFLGPSPLLRQDWSGNFEARPAGELREIFGWTYDTETWESRIRSVNLIAEALNKRELAGAMMLAVLMRLPDPADAIGIADIDAVLAKAGFNPDEPRDERGRWTSGDANGDPERRSAGVQLADAGLSDAFNDPVTQAAARAAETGTGSRSNIILAAADDEDEKDPRFGIGGNNPPLEELIPQRLLQSPAGPNPVSGQSPGHQ